MEIILLLIAGSIAGGIVNYLADRLPYQQKQPPLAYRDGTPRPPLAWLGILAFLTGQRVPTSNAECPPLSWRYPLTELLTALLFVMTYSVRDSLFGMTTPQFLLYLLYMAILMLILIIDIEHKLILFAVMIPSIILALIDALVLPPPEIAEALRGAAFAFIVFYILYAGGFLFTYIMGSLRGQRITTVAFGFGDVMLITFAGALLGVAYTVLTIFIAVFLGAFGAIVYLMMRLALKGRYTLFTAIPYGPYIVFATIMMLLYGRNIWFYIFGYFPG